MNIEEFRTYCLSKKGVNESLPFGDNTLVYKVMGKMFALTGLDTEEFQCNLKCEPERAVQLREEHPNDITPGYHMNKQHWNTVYGERNLSDELMRELIDHSYELVVQSLKKAEREALNNL